MDDATVERWGREGRSWIAQEFSSARYYDRLVELYSQYGTSYEA
jgi:hypothetical protein